MEDGTIVAVDFNYEEDDEDDPEIDLTDLTNEEREEILREHDREAEGPMTRQRLLRTAAIRRLQDHHHYRNRQARTDREEEKKNIEGE